MLTETSFFLVIKIWTFFNNRQDNGVLDYRSIFMEFDVICMVKLNPKKRKNTNHQNLKYTEFNKNVNLTHVNVKIVTIVGAILFDVKIVTQ